MHAYGPQLYLVVTFCCRKDKTKQKKTFTLFVIAEQQKKKKKIKTSVKNFILFLYVIF